jgi:acetyl-CoA carboxylase biotin carboxylase subunit
MFRKILIANRGEVAVRVIRACRDLGISPIAVYSEADASALHVRLADDAYLVGPAPSAESYLRIERIVEAARVSGAEAVHPGYGFLAENAAFARAVNGADLVFIGPTPEAMELMGSKISARLAALAAGAPVVPGTTEPLRSFEDARETAIRLGYPVMLKAAAGGGGKGMRLVTTEAELASAMATARSEAQSAFGDDAVYLEKAIERPRHIEIQIFGDTQGSIVHLGERECSIQRRHQKVIEECPSPIADSGLRERMGAAAVAVARACSYVGAGTVEFLVSDVTREFYFLEMNTRLQVEHPVTEFVTGLDLVREQINVASGKPLSFTQDQVSMRGHAIECRIYAEDPDNDFFPSPGRIAALRVPTGPCVRDDSGVYEGAEVSIYYDPLISKLATWGRTRAEAIERMRRALGEYEVIGIRTTLPFFRAVLADEEFIGGNIDTGFIDRFNRRRPSSKTRHMASDGDVACDVAIIAAALRYADKKLDAAAIENAEVSRWRLSGRIALHNTLDLI